MQNRFVVLFCGCVSLLLACSDDVRSNAGADAGTPGADAGNTDLGSERDSDLGAAIDSGAAVDAGPVVERPLSADEAALFDGGIASLNIITQVLALAETFIPFDSVLSPSQTPQMNADAILEHSLSRIGECGTARIISEGYVQMDFGTGCILPNGLSVSGMSSVQAQLRSGTLTVLVTMPDLLNGLSLDGQIGFSTEDGVAFTLANEINLDETQITLVGLAFRGAGDGMTFSGRVQTVVGAQRFHLMFADTLYKAGDCYPSGGTLDISDGHGTLLTVAFSSPTATSGQVTVTRELERANTTLSAWGSCPSAP